MLRVVHQQESVNNHQYSLIQIKFSTLSSRCVALSFVLRAIYVFRPLFYLSLKCSCAFAMMM